MRKGITILFIITAWNTSGFCASEPNSGFAGSTLNDYLSYAETNNVGLKNSYQQWQSALDEALQMKHLSNPKVRYDIDERKKSMRTKQVTSVMQAFPWFGKVDVQIEAAIYEASAAYHRYQAARLLLFKEVKDGFYEYAYLAGAREIAEEHIELTKRFEEVARARHPRNKIANPDTVKTREEILKTGETLRGLRQLREPMVSRLRTALSLPDDANLPWPHADMSGREFNAVEINYEHLVSILTQKNSELAALREEQAAARSRVTFAEKNVYPDMGVGMEWTQFDGPQKDKDKDSVALLFQLKLSVERGGADREVKRAKNQVMSIEQQRIDTENALLTQAAQKYSEFNDSMKDILLYRDTLVPEGRERLRVAEKEYREGKKDISELLEARRTLMKHQLSYLRAVTDNRKILAELELLAGTGLDEKQADIKN
jgi:cobalt-zinc-cadmium efflux system outer membrane protein